MTNLAALKVLTVAQHVKESINSVMLLDTGHNGYK